MIQKEAPAGCDGQGVKAEFKRRYALYSAQPSKSQQPQLRLVASRDPTSFDRLVRARAANAEARIQAAIVEWVRLVAPDALIFAIPNGGLRSKTEAARMKWTGTLAGMPDLAVVAPAGRVHFLEVKAQGGSLSASQRVIHEALIALGTPPAIVRSIDDCRRAFTAWGIETREVGA